MLLFLAAAGGAISSRIKRHHLLQEWCCPDGSSIIKGERGAI